MSTSPDMEAPYEPVSAEVARVDDSQRREFDRLHASMHERALMAAGRAEGAALVVSNQILELQKDHGGRLAVLEDSRREMAGDVKEIKASIGGIKQTLTSMAAASPIQQALYAMTAIVVLSYFGALLWDRVFGAGSG